MWKLLDVLFPPREDELVLRGIDADGFCALVAPRLAPVTHPETTALLSFGDPRVRAAIHETKYHGSSSSRRLLAHALAGYMRDSDEGFGTPILVPIPLGPKRAAERGFNQAEEVLRLAMPDGTINTALLVRARETCSQAALPREKRLENMRDAFTATGPADPARTYMLFDDVVTTGATMQAAIDALAAAGATHIVPIALAH